MVFNSAGIDMTDERFISNSDGCVSKGFYNESKVSNSQQ